MARETYMAIIHLIFNTWGISNTQLSVLGPLLPHYINFIQYNSDVPNLDTKLISAYYFSNNKVILM